MSCDNLPIPKPLTSQCPTTVFGIPYGTGGRVVANTAFEIQGIVLHCYPGTSEQLCNELKCRTKSSILSGSTENSYHYGIGVTGHVSQYVQDCDISWSFGAYKNNSYAQVPPPNTPINWPTLQGINGLNTTPDVYVLNVALALGHQVLDSTGCYQCPTSSSLPETQHEELVQLLAFLASEYNIPIDTEHIQFHDAIRCDDTMACPDCVDIATLLGEVAAYCPPCEGDEAPSAPEAQPDDVINYVMGITEACCPSSPGCYVKIPWDGCFIGDLATDGDLADYILGLTVNQAGQFCLTKGCLAVTSPLIGCGTVADPLRLDLCLWGSYIPDEPAANMITIVGLDALGCIIETPLEDAVRQFPPECDDIKNIFTTTGDIETFIGLDAAGDCVQGTLADTIESGICDIAEMAVDPTWILAKDDTTCPVFTTPESVVAAGFSTVDSDCINITWVNNQLSIDPIINPAADNLLSCGVNGLYVPDLTVLSSDCIEIYYTNRQITMAPVISPPIGGITNQISCTITGFFVPRGADALVNGPLTGNGSDLNPIDIDFSLMSNQDLCDFGGAIPAGVVTEVLGTDVADCLRVMSLADVVAAGLVANDTACIDLTLTGNVLTAVPIISPAIGGINNVLTCTATGLYVPAGAGLTSQNTSCIATSIVAGIISSTPILDPQVTNQLSCGINGLYVPPAAGLIANDTDCLDLDLTGGVLTGTILLAGPQGGVPNVANCIPGQGFYVPEGGGLQVLDTSCMNLTLTGAVLQADVIIDPTGDNQVQCLPAGLYVPPTAGLIANNTDCIALNLAGDTLTATPILAPAQGGVPNAITCITGQGLFVPNTVAGIDVFSITDDQASLETIVGGNVITFEGINGATQRISSVDTVTVDGHMICDAGPPVTQPPYDLDQLWVYNDTTTGAVYTWNCATSMWNTPAHVLNGAAPPTAATCLTNTTITANAEGVWTPGISTYAVPGGSAETSFERIWVLTRNCVWAQVSGDGATDLSLGSAQLNVPAGTTYVVPLDTNIGDQLGIATLPSVTIQRAGVYMFAVAGSLTWASGDFDSALLSVTLRRGAVAFQNVVDVPLTSFSTNPVGLPITIPFRGEFYREVQAGDVIDLSVNFSTNFGGGTYNITQASMRVTSDLS